MFSLAGGLYSGRIAEGVVLVERVIFGGFFGRLFRSVLSERFYEFSGLWVSGRLGLSG